MLADCGSDQSKGLWIAVPLPSGSLALDNGSASNKAKWEWERGGERPKKEAATADYYTSTIQLLQHDCNPVFNMRKKCPGEMRPREQRSFEAAS